jgi:hypothetical protein
MCCGISDDRLMLRLGADLAAAALDGKHVQPMDFTGTALKTMVFVDPPGCRGEKALKQWFDQAAGFVATLPPKGRGKGK